MRLNAEERKALGKREASGRFDLISKGLGDTLLKVEFLDYRRYRDFAQFTGCDFSDVGILDLSKVSWQGGKADFNPYL